MSATMLAVIGSRRPCRLSAREYPKYGMTAVTCAAEARRHASTKASSSIKWSLTGGEVGWMMKTWRPRTGSSSRTDSSPSGNLSTEHAPSRAPISTATLVASATLALPAKMVKSSFIFFPRWILHCVFLMKNRTYRTYRTYGTSHKSYKSYKSYKSHSSHSRSSPAIKMCASSEEGFGGFHQGLRER